VAFAKFISTGDRHPMGSSTRTRKPRALKASLQLCGSAVALLALCSSAPAAQQQVDLKLVLATDVSGSIDNDELRLEREGTADAFLDPDVIKAIQGGSLGRIAVTMIDFSSPQFDKVVIDWQIIHDRASAAAFAETVRDTPRTPGRRTSVSSALELGSLLIEASEKDIVATRKVIDVSGDGPNNDGNPMTETHDKVVAQGIVVNGLPIMDDNANGYYPDLDKYYAACVAGGRGSFVVVVHSYKDFHAAMRHKLILEISQNELRTKQAKSEMPKNHLLMKAAATTQAQSEPVPQVLRPGTNEFSKQCDIAGGFGGFGGRF
jgi:hypothetical protein